MPNLSELYEASFRGVSFLFRNGTTSLGRKTVTHEYPQRDERFVEDLGKFSKTFSVNVVISGNDYFAKRNSLNNALEQPGPGQLIHPFYGSITVSVKTVVVSEDTQKFGEADYQIEFETTLEDPLLPTSTFSPKSSILGVNNNIFAGVESLLAKGFLVSSKFPRNYTDAINLIDGVFGQFSVVSSLFNLGGVASDLLRRIRDIRSIIPGLIKDPDTLASNIVDVFNDSQELVADNPITREAINKTWFNFGDEDLIAEELTPERIERANNRRLVNTSIQTLALANEYENTTLQDFSAETDIETKRNLLETQYQKIVNSQILDDDTLENLQEARNTVRAYFDEQLINAYKINEIDTVQIPITVLAYKYYGDVDLTERLIELNNSDYPSAVQGTLKVLGK